MRRLQLSIPVFAILAMFHGCTIGPTRSDNGRVITPLLKIAKTIDTDAIDSIYAIVTGDNISGETTFPMVYDKASKSYSGTISVPREGANWTLTIVLLDASGKKIGQGSSSVTNVTTVVTVPVISSTGAIPSISIQDSITVTINDTIVLSGTATDAFDGVITVYTWYSNETGSWVAIAETSTVKIKASSTPGDFLCRLEATDDDGNLAMAQLSVSVVQDIPTVHAGNDTTVYIGDQVVLHGTAGNQPNSYTVKWEWNIGGSGFKETSSGDTTITMPATDHPSYPCILRVTDEDSNTATDTMYIQVGRWVTVGGAGFSDSIAEYTSLAFHNGEAYVAYVDAAESNKATVMKYNDSNWVAVGSPGFSTGTARYTSLAIYNGEPYVAYADAADSNKATVMKYNGSNWVTVGSGGFSAGTANHTSLAFYNGEPYVAYSDVDSGYRATVMKYDGSNWVIVGNRGFSADMVEFTSLAFYNGEPYVAYRDFAASSLKATVMKYNGSNWVAVGSPEFSPARVDYTSLAFYNGEPYVAFMDGMGKATVMKYNGSNWVTVGSRLFSSGDAPYTSLAFNNGEPYVAYMDYGNNKKATVMRYDGSSWIPVGSAGFSADRADYTSLAFYNGEPYVAYMDYGNGQKASVMKLR